MHTPVYIFINHQFTDTLPDGKITLWFYSNQPENNTYFAFIKIDQGMMSFEFDELPDFWFDYTLYDSSGNEVPVTWFSLSFLILLPVVLICKKKRDRSEFNQ